MTPTITGCRAIVEYGLEFQNATADELKATQGANHHSRYPHVSQMIVDYGVECDALKARQ